MKQSLLSAQMCRDYPDRPAIAGSGTSFTYAELPCWPGKR